MLYEFVLPLEMRQFQAVAPGRRLMHPSERVAAGTKVLIRGVTIMSFDHKDKLALVDKDWERFFLIEEIGLELRRDAFAWSYAHEDSDAAAQTRLIEQRLSPKVREHVRPHLVVAGKELSDDPSANSYPLLTTFFPQT